MRLFIVLLVCFLFNITSFGQYNETDTIVTTDSIDYSDVDFSFFMMDLNYTNNTIKSNSKSFDIEIPAFISDFTYLHKSGLETGLMVTNYSGADTLSYDLDFKFGYQKSFYKDIFDIDINYTYHAFYGMNDYKGLDYKHNLNLSAGFTYEMLYVYGSGTYYLDNENYFNDLGLTINVDFENVLFQNDFIFLLPALSLTYGTDYYLYDLYEPYIENVIIPLLRYRGYQTINLTNEDVVERYLTNQGLSTNTYSYQGIDFLIPFTYGMNNISASFSWIYYIPSDKLKAFGMKDQSGFIISLSFIF